MNYTECIEYLYGLTHHGIKLGLENPRRLLSILGNPERKFRSVHIAGTNGKGSTAVMLAGLLQAAGWKVGLFTSPHLIRFTERIRVNGEEIKEEEVTDLTSRIREQARREPDLRPTFFEFVTALAFSHFSDSSVDWAVVETGLGGRFDATNVINPDLTIITPVGMDHREFLGDTLEEIAFEKAGIIKESTPLVLSSQNPGARDVILQRAETLSSPVTEYGRDFTATLKGSPPGGMEFDFHTISGGSVKASINGIEIPLLGRHQVENASVAIEAFLELLKEKESPASLSRMIRDALLRTSWPGRLEFRSFLGMPLLLDGAHNGDAARSLAGFLKDLLKKGDFRGITLIFGAMKDKNIRDILAPLLPITERLIITAAGYERSETPSGIRNLVLSDPDLSASLPRTELLTAPGVEEALNVAHSLSRDGELAVLTGSLYLVGDAMEVLGGTPVLRELSESR